MNLKQQVIWTHAAENDLKAIIEYLAQDRPKAAFEMLKRIKDKASNLYILPECGRIVPELQDQVILQYRELIVPPWRLIYKIFDQTVFVLSLIDSRQNVEDILLKRMILKT